MLFIILCIGLLSSASARGGCDNNCNGHGDCGDQGECQCWDNWGSGEDAATVSGDCRDRVCAYSWAWAEGPTKLGHDMQYSECGGKGMCNRETGDCECFVGYEGLGCARSSCPNDCNGHGRCQFIEHFGFGVSANSYSAAMGDSVDIFQQDDPYKFKYRGWDAGKTRACVCDPQYTDIDCSKRMCPFGNDVEDGRANMNSAAKSQTQMIKFTPYRASKGYSDDPARFSGKTFALKFTTKMNETYTTNPIVYLKERVNNVNGDCHDLTLDIEAALQALPGGCIDQVKVSSDCEGENGQSAPYFTHFNITFTGSRVQGEQRLMEVLVNEQGAGCTPVISGLELKVDSTIVTELVSSDLNSWECGNRGSCDYDTGVCDCYGGFSGDACGQVTTLL